MQVSPPAYKYQGQSAAVQTNSKTIILSRTKPAAADEAYAIVTGQKSTIDGGKYVRNLIQTLYSQEVAIGGAIGDVTSSVTSGFGGPISELATGVAGSIGNVGNEISTTLGKASGTITEALKPVSTALGGVLGTLTGVAKDPLGAITLLPQTLADVVKKVNPNFAARMEGTFKKYKLDNFAHLPQQVMGSIKNLITALDAIIAIPLAIIQDLYRGLMIIMQAISDIVDQIVNVVLEFFMNLLNELLLLDVILEFISAVSTLASEIGGIASIFLGSNPITAFANNVQGFANQLGGIISNPMNLISSYLPASVSQGLYVLNNPQQLLNSIIPPGISQQFAKISQITGFGFNGNMGFGFESVLNGLQGGVISSILNNFASQYSILTPLVGLAGQSGSPSSTPSLTPAGADPSQVTTHGVVQPQAQPQRPISGQGSSGGGGAGQPLDITPGIIPGSPSISYEQAASTA